MSLCATFWTTSTWSSRAVSTGFPERQFCRRILPWLQVTNAACKTKFSFVEMSLGVSIDSGKESSSLHLYWALCALELCDQGEELCASGFYTRGLWHSRAGVVVKFLVWMI